MISHQKRHGKGCKPEEEKEPQAVCDCCHVDARCKCRIYVHHLQDDRDQEAGKGGADHVHDHRKPCDQPEPWIEIVEKGDRSNQSADYDSVQKSCEDLFEEYAFCVVFIDFIQR